MLFQAEDDPEAVYVVPRLWVPEFQLENKHNPNRELYKSWHKAGFLQITPGNVIDYDAIERQIVADSEMFGVEEFAIDHQFQGRQFSQRLAEAGMSPVPFRQGFLTYGPAMSEFERRLLGGKVRHGGHPVLRWMFDNLHVERDSAGNFKPSKSNKNWKIDGIVALVMALDRVSRRATVATQFSGPEKVGGVTVW
jgi:phage terminase large subunit-like protein